MSVKKVSIPNQINLVDIVITFVADNLPPSANTFIMESSKHSLSIILKKNTTQY